MSNIYWKQPVDADFATASDWGGGVVPGAGDAAILNVTRQDYTVSTDENQTVGSLSLRSNATLAIAGGVFDAIHGTGSGVNAGEIIVNRGASVTVTDSLSNSGNLYVETGGAIVAECSVTGSGQVSFEYGGTMNFTSTLNQAVTFVGTGDLLVLETHKVSAGP